MKLVNKESMLLSFPTTERWISVFKEWFSFLFFPRVKLTFALIKYWDFCFGFMLHHLFASLEWRRIFLAFRLHSLPVAGTYSVPLHSAEQIEAWWLRCENVFRCATLLAAAASWSAGSQTFTNHPDHRIAFSPSSSIFLQLLKSLRGGFSKPSKKLRGTVLLPVKIN